MPTVLRFEGMRVVIYPNDHRPAHVHVIGASGEAVFNLQCPDGPPVMRENFGLGRSVLGKIADELTLALAMLCAAWGTIHVAY